MVSHCAVQALTFMTLLPATALASVWQPEALAAGVRSQPLALQSLEILVLADLTQYGSTAPFTGAAALALPRGPPLEPRARLAGRLPLHVSTSSSRAAW